MDSKCWEMHTYLVKLKMKLAGALWVIGQLILISCNQMAVKFVRWIIALAFLLLGILSAQIYSNPDVVYPRPSQDSLG